MPARCATRHSCRISHRAFDAPQENVSRVNPCGAAVTNRRHAVHCLTPLAPAAEIEAGTPMSTETQMSPFAAVSRKGLVVLQLIAAVSVLSTAAFAEDKPAAKPAQPVAVSSQKTTPITPSDIASDFWVPIGDFSAG